MRLPSPQRALSLLLYLFVSVLVSLPAAAQFRPSKEWRTINTDQYEISVQKNGRTDLKFVSGVPIFENAFPAVRYADDSEIAPLPIRAQASARQEVHDKLGSGNGLALRYEACEWQLRAYPTKPYLAVQVIYHNTRKKPVRIAELLPWCVGAPNRGAVQLGADAAATRILQAGDPAAIVEQSSWGRSHLAAYNPVSGRNLIAGFLSSERAWTAVGMSRSADAAADVFDQFRSVCRYDPPVELQPGASLASEVFYIAVTEADPLFGLRRYGKAVAVWNGVRDARPFTPHGMRVPGTDAATVRTAMATLSKQGKPLGMRHLSIGPEWQSASGEFDPLRFPDGMQALATEAHTLGLTIGLELAPFRIDAQDPLAASHPEWIVTTEEGVAALDVTAPGALEHVVALARRIGGAWGYDALVDTDSAALLLKATALHTEQATRVEAFRLALGALREGLGDGKVLVAGGPAEMSGAIADVVRMGGMGSADAMRQAVNRFYWTPSLFLSAPVPSATASPAARLSDYSCTALLGGVIQVHPDDLATPDALKHLLPIAERPAVPLDFFGAETRNVYHLPFDTKAGQWHTLGLFNGGGGEEVFRVEAHQLGLAAEQYFTVFNMQAQHYHGLAQGRLEVRVGAGDYGIYGIRPFRNRPMLVALGSNFGMGALEHTRIEWNPASRMLSGDFDAEGGRAYTLHFLVPKAWTLSAARFNGATVDWKTVDDTVQIAWTSPAETRSAGWRLQFSAASAP